MTAREIREGEIRDVMETAGLSFAAAMEQLGRVALEVAATYRRLVRRWRALRRSTGRGSRGWRRHIRRVKQ